MKNCLKDYQDPQIELFCPDARDVLTTSDGYGEIAEQLSGGNDDAWNIKYR